VFIGRGLSQVTGRGNYEALGAKVGLDLADHPDLVNDPANALECGVADFVICGCLPFAEADDVSGVTRRLNGGLTGLEERIGWLARWKAALGGGSLSWHTAT
jgi:putative chitinase